MKRDILLLSDSTVGGKRERGVAIAHLGRSGPCVGDTCDLWGHVLSERRGAKGTSRCARCDEEIGAKKARR